MGDPVPSQLDALRKAFEESKSIYDRNLKPIMRIKRRQNMPDQILTKMEDHTTENVYRCKENEHIYISKKQGVQILVRK